MVSDSMDEENCEVGWVEERWWKKMMYVFEFLSDYDAKSKLKRAGDYVYISMLYVFDLESDVVRILVKRD